MKNVRCELVSGEDISFLEGKLKTLIEAVIPENEMTLDTKRSKAIKDMVQIILWNWFNVITDHITDHLQEKKKWYKEK